MTELSVREEFFGLIYRLPSYRPETFEKAEDSSFLKEINYIFQEVQTYGQELINNQIFLSDFTENELRVAYSSLERLIKQLDAARNYIPNGALSSRRANKENFIEEITRAYDDFYRQVVSRYIKYKSRESINLLKDIRNTKEQSEQILEHQKETSGKIAVNSFANIFEREALRYDTSKRIWVWLSIVFAVFLCWLIWWALEPLVSHVGQDEYIHVLVAKFLIVSFASFAYFQIFIKNLNANRHLCTINKHRANILRTYESLIDSANSNESKDAILLQTTKAIYDMGETGYVSSKDSHNPYEVASLIEMFNKK